GEIARVGQCRELVVGRHARDHFLHALALGDVAAHAAIALEGAALVDDGLAADERRMRERAVRVAAHELQVAERLVPLQRELVIGPEVLAELAVSDFPALLADEASRIDAEEALEAAVDAREGELRILLPIPVRGEARDPL